MALKWRHAGQACITANRIYVQKGVYKDFTDLVAKKTKELKVGHGAKEGTTLGPLTTPRSIDKALAHVEDAKKNGARVLFGGNKVEIDDGYFFEPTIVLDAHDGLMLAQEEQFSPIAAFFPFETEEAVVKAANNTSMGLASYFFTKNVDRTWRLLETLEAGQIGMNTGNMSSAEIPFGGIKMSGYGKESGKDVAVEEYLITKTGVLSLEGHY
jgi:succinate-semialdehyde dehydrogenase/glutarate-semialdehyde dehydrogenase